MCQKCLQRDMPKCYEACDKSIPGKERTWSFDVEHAYTLITPSTMTATAPEKMLEGIVTLNGFEPEHLEHVDMSKPILLGMIPWEVDCPCAIIVGDSDIPFEQFNETNAYKFLPMDGSHRAARALRDGISIKMYILSESETMSCLVSVETEENNTVIVSSKALHRMAQSV